MRKRIVTVGDLLSDIGVFLLKCNSLFNEFLLLIIKPSTPHPPSKLSAKIYLNIENSEIDYRKISLSRNS